MNNSHTTVYWSKGNNFLFGKPAELTVKDRAVNVSSGKESIFTSSGNTLKVIHKANFTTLDNAQGSSINVRFSKPPLWAKIFLISIIPIAVLLLALIIPQLGGETAILVPGFVILISPIPGILARKEDTNSEKIAFYSQFSSHTREADPLKDYGREPSIIKYAEYIGILTFMTVLYGFLILVLLYSICEKIGLASQNASIAALGITVIVLVLITNVIFKIFRNRPLSKEVSMVTIFKWIGYGALMYVVLGAGLLILYLTNPGLQ